MVYHQILKIYVVLEFGGGGGWCDVRIALDHGIFTSILCGNLPESAEKYKDSKFYYKNNTAECTLCVSVSINFPHGGSLDIPMEGCLNSKAFTRRKV